VGCVHGIGGFVFIGQGLVICVPGYAAHDFIQVIQVTVGLVFHGYA
jgi:hypothetical protein